MISTFGAVQLSDRMIFALLAVAVADTKNIGEVAGDTHYLTFNGGSPLIINSWWGQKAGLVEVTKSIEMPLVTLKLSPWTADD